MSDVRRVFTVQAIRAFLYGFSSILIGASLAAGGLDAVAVGAVFTAVLLGMAVSSLAVGRWGEGLGRRRTYLGLLAIMGVAGAVFGLTNASTARFSRARTPPPISANFTASWCPAASASAAPRG
jgi:MFS family permease